VSRLAANDPTHRRITAQALGVVQVLVSREASEYGLPQHPDQRMPAILARSRIRERFPGDRAEAERVVQFPISEQPTIGGHHRTAKLKHQLGRNLA
jgi:hypothetical protein